MKIPARLALLCLAVAGWAAGSPAVTVTGRVVDRLTRDALPAFVLPEAGGAGVSADAQGRFKLTLDLPQDASPIRLTVFLLGYKKAVVEVRPGIDAEILLDRDVADVQEISVTADSGVSSNQTRRTVSLSKMETYTTPGTAADPLYAGQVLPGVNAAPDSSSLLIRGGAPDEVGYYLDGLEIPHPFLSESLHESYFSIFDNQVIDRFNISTSGFPPKINDALSGVMDIEIKDSAPDATGGIGLSVLGPSGQIGLPVGTKGALILSGSRSDSRFLNRINNRSEGDFQNEQAFGKFIWTVHPAHRVRFYGLWDSYRYDEDASLAVASGNGLAALTWTYTPASRILLKTSLAASSYISSMEYGQAFRMQSEDRTLQARVDGAFELGAHRFEFGLNARDRHRDFDFTEEDPLHFDVRGRRYGFYLQDQVRLSDRILITAGANALALNLGRGGVFLGPRVATAYLLSDKDVLRFSTGVYRQSGDEFTLRRNPGLEPKTAVHFSLSYDRIGETAEFRATVYDKEYTRLYLNEPDGAVSSGGRGFARGAEAFLKITQPGYSLLGVYNFLSSKRRENDSPELADSPYAIAHSVTLVAAWTFKSGSIGLRYSYATGRPYTPLLGTEPGEDGEILPVWDASYSGRYPAYRRLDLNGTVRISVARRMIVGYFGVTNVLDRDNISRYEYSEDYSTRIDQPSLFGRTVFLGLYIPFF
ncbi:MAG: TonB-dependent receptor [Candidatus Aminicenantes bacterium]|nr:TonB-dependent receptor [Candidatus Aminicenantes bacterium]